MFQSCRYASFSMLLLECFLRRRFFNVNLAICFVSIFNFNTLLHLMRGPRKFCQRGSKFESVFFLVCSEEEGSKYHY